VIIDRAIERPELAAGTDARFALELLVALLYARVLLIRQSVGNAHRADRRPLLRGLSRKRGTPPDP
jgi:hypothetical protein